MTVCIIHYNTPVLTTAAIMSLDKHTPGCDVVIFDNSDRRPFPSGRFRPEVIITDNTRGQIIPFNDWLATISDKQPTNNGYASAKHCITVQWLIDHMEEPFLLMDSDILICQDVSPLFDNSQSFVGKQELSISRNGNVMRVLPYLLYINTPMVKAHGVTFFNQNKMWALTSHRPDNAYDTGAWFLEDCRNHALPYREIDINQYCIHLGHASWKKKDAQAWLKEHKNLWR